MSQVNTTVVVKKSLLYSTLICLPAALFYLYEFILQVSPSVITNELMRDFSLNAAGLGTMAAFYYYAYTPMQLPAGLLYDRYGPRVLLTIAILICALGALFFSLTHSVAIASTGRFLMGIGSAFSFIGALLLISRWFPPYYFAMLAGIVQLMSSIGAIAGQVPIAAAVANWGWRNTIGYLTLFGILLAAMAWLIIRDAPADFKISPNHTGEKTTETKRLWAVCGNPQTWFAGLYTFAIWAPVVAFAALWGVPFLVTAYGVSTNVASIACAMIWLGIGIGSPLAGWWSDRIGRRCLPLTWCALIGLLAITAVIFIPHLPLPLLFILLFITGVASSGQSLSFGVVKDNNHPRQVGTAIGFNNMATVAGGALFQPLVGILLQAHWSGTVRENVPVYSIADYHFALWVLPFCFLIAMLASAVLLKETRCQHNY